MDEEIRVEPLPAKAEPVNLFGNPVPMARQRKAARMLKRYARKYRYDEDAFYPLFVEDNRVIGPFIGVKNVVSGAALEKLDANRGVAIGTIRMGYGHYRIAMAIASAANSMGLVPYWFDLLGFKTPGARMIRDIDYWYSLASRMSQKSKLFNDYIWDPLLGKAYKRVEKNYPLMQIARLFADVYKDIPPDMPFVGTHPWPAQAAVFAGMSNVINVVPDNCPLGFHLAPGALHTVQSSSAYMIFRTLKELGNKGEIPKGLASSELAMAGNYVDHELVANAEADCAARMDRITRKRPRRLLISVGGAGAQQPLFVSIVRALWPLIEAGDVALYLNFGDHRKVYDLLRREIPRFEETATRHFDWAETTRFAQDAVNGDVKGLHTFLNDDTFAAVYTTNMLMRSADILLTKPSELAFYPVPTLFLPRVGGHEAWGAIHASELGYGTSECTSAAMVLQTLDLMISEDDLLTLYCENIVKLKHQGVFNGAYRVIELALERRRS
ncbi:MAG TPA: hypothetical protein P5318_13410 [Candidatus Hydrogenedentes bacterium]|nr:hypothetical protein [Candidatus Hydrogenedentota bacterium]HRT21117.1 hypothetical protein [Candidatus Hydrogenedentota bacterium]HRT64342.1 hypothetical protein [Candidatus Hydrogenedentota bacterium]